MQLPENSNLETVFKRIEEQHQKYKFMEYNLATKKTRYVCSRPKTYDGYSALHTQHSIWLGIPERRMWILPHFKIPLSNTLIWGWGFKYRVLRNRHKFRAWTSNLWWIFRTLHSGFTLHTQDSPIQIHWVLSVECWVSVISLGPGH